MASEWLKIRHWNGSQELAFEELCCQLARHEPVPSGSRFERIGSPDAGVECLWRLPNEDEWGWQAKFFTSSLTAGQWAQLDSSVETALEKRPKLRKYTICLPLNFPDARVTRKRSALDQWNQHVRKWETWAKDRAMTVEFLRWDESLIFSLLSKDEHKGRRFFWFSEELLSIQWFGNQIAEASDNAGPRYTPELNVDLEIAKNFDGLGRTSRFFDRVAGLYGELRRRNAHCYSRDIPESAARLFANLGQCMACLLMELEAAKQPTDEEIPLDSILAAISNCKEAVHECTATLEEYEKSEAHQKALKERDGSSRPGEYHRGVREYRSDLDRLFSVLRKVENALETKEAELANLPALLIVGDAGIGKTHLLCDVAQRRLRDRYPSLLLLGGQFTDAEPWGQIIRLAGLNCTRDEFLGSLDAAGSAAQGRALILIDALNEGSGTSLWPKHLAGMVTALSRYRHVAIAVTVRSSYELTIIPTGLVPQRLIRIVHEGFSDSEYRAMKMFFDHFGIQHPSVPLLAPEFQNPLFLKVFCQALENLGLTRIPPGLTGITQLLTFFLDSVNIKLSRADRLDFDSSDRPVNLAIDRLAQLMAENATSHLGYAQARDAVNALLPRDGFERSLFKNLLSEGVLAKERILVALPDRYEEVVRFAYERFTDHLIAKHLLDRSLNATQGPATLKPASPVELLFKDEFSCWRNRGLLEAFCVQVPERVGREMPDLLTQCASCQAMRLAFVKSLIWRKPSAVNEATLKYLNTHVIRYSDSHAEFLDALLTVASYPEHPYNAGFLHRHLSRFEMAERDAWWSVFLHHHYSDGGAIERLIDWAWSNEDKSHINDDSVLLAAITLAWFLTSSNRYLRDRSTKALVSLLTPRIKVLRRLVHTFRDVNDLYVAERIYAVANGCALRSSDRPAVAELAREVYNNIFPSGNPIPHVLLRDYARGVIEVTARGGIQLDIDMKRVRPPYKSKWPGKIPTIKELQRKYGTWHEGMPEEELAALSIFSSVMDGDFGRYIIGTNFGRREYSSRRLGRRYRKTHKQRADSFMRSLTKSQKIAFQSYEEKRRALEMQRWVELTAKAEGSSMQAKRKAEQPEARALRAALGAEKNRIFVTYVLPYLRNPRIDEEKNTFDLRIAQRWILQRVLELGWTSGRFGRFDRNLQYYGGYGREEHKSERIGKKYQWIAYHEFLSLLLDNFEFRGESGGERAEKYEGPWQLTVRDIDPSLSLVKTESCHQPAWWAPVGYHDWNRIADDRSWIAESKDLPDPKSLLIVTNPTDGSRWITLEGWYQWEEPSPPDQERFENERRQIWSLIRCCLTKREDAGTLFSWAKKQDFMGRWMPENSDVWRIFLGEFSWAPAFRFIDRPYYGHPGWSRGSQKVVPRPVLPTADVYLGESATRDCSIVDTVHITTPCRFILEGMDLRWNGNEGYFFDSNARLIAFDPSVKNPGPHATLIREDAFRDFLRRVDCDLFWMLLGEKLMIGGSGARGHWKGRLNVSGAFRLSGDEVEGVINTKHEAPR